MALPRTAESPGVASTIVLVKIPIVVPQGSMHTPLAGSRLLSFLQVVLAWAVQFTGSSSALTVLLYCLS